MKLKGSVWNALGSLMWGAQSFIMLTLVSRVAPLEQIGWFGIAFTTAQILYIVGLFGVSHFQMTDYAEKYPFKVYFRSRMLSALLMIAGCAAVILCMRFSKEKALYTIALTILMLVHVFGDLYQNLFFQKNRLDLSGSSQFVRTAGSVAAFCAALLLTHNILIAVALQTVVGFVLMLVYALVLSKPYRSAEPLCGKDAVLSLIRECLPLFFSMLFMNLIINASKYGVEWYLDDTAQGYFNMIFMPAQVINLCSQFIFKPYLKQYADALESSAGARLKKLLARQLLLIAVLTAAACGGAYFLGAPVLGFLYKKDIAEYTLEMVWIVLGGGAFAACQLFYYILVLCRKQKQILMIYAGGTGISAVFSILFVRHFALAGAALAFLVTHLILLIGYFIFVRKYALSPEGGKQDA